MFTTIVDVKAREILDSRGNPTVEVDVLLDDGSFGRAAVPSGASTGAFEACELRDSGAKRYMGKGVLNAVKNVNEKIAPEVLGADAALQEELDQLMIELDGTLHKSRLGGNAIYALSVAVARAAAESLKVPLYRYLGGIAAHSLPIPLFNMINGGPYSHVDVEFQEFMLAPIGAKNYREALRMGVEVFYRVGEVIKKRYGQERLHLGHSAGYAAPVGNPAEMIETLLEAAGVAGYEGKFQVGLDCAASHFYDNKRDCYLFQRKEASRDNIITYLEHLASSYPILMIEDPLQEDDFEGFAEITKRLNLVVAGDDLFVTDPERLNKGILLGAANAMIFKPNMVGTLTEAFDAAALARRHAYSIIPSCRAGGSVDDPIPDVTVALNAPFVKLGAPRSGERTTYQNRLLRIEEELGPSAEFSTPKGIQ